MPKSDSSFHLDPVDAPDPDTGAACALLGIAKETLYRLARRKLVTGYLLAGRRRWDLASLRAYKQACRDAGPQFGQAPTGKRARGRPREPRTDAQPSAAE
jgi:Helix-turn-helix domain